MNYESCGSQPHAHGVTAMRRVKGSGRAGNNAPVDLVTRRGAELAGR